MKKLLKLFIILVCLLWTSNKLFAQSYDYSGSQYYFPPPEGLVPSTQDFINAATDAVMKSTTGTSVKTHTNSRSNTSTSTKRSAQNSRSNDKRTCPICLGDGKCFSVNATASSYDFYCHGDGICRECSGKGIVINPYTGNYIKCSNCWVGETGKCGRCRGTGKCSTCNGKGKI